MMDNEYKKAIDLADALEHACLQGPIPLASTMLLAAALRQANSRHVRATPVAVARASYGVPYIGTREAKSDSSLDSRSFAVNLAKHVSLDDFEERQLAMECELAEALGLDPGDIHESSWDSMIAAVRFAVEQAARSPDPAWDHEFERTDSKPSEARPALSKAEVSALKELGRGDMYRDARRWAHRVPTSKGTGFAAATIAGLVKLGLARVWELGPGSHAGKRPSSERERVQITTEGRQWLDDDSRERLSGSAWAF